MCLRASRYGANLRRCVRPERATNIVLSAVVDVADAHDAAIPGTFKLLPRVETFGTQHDRLPGFPAEADGRERQRRSFDPTACWGGTAHRQSRRQRGIPEQCGPIGVVLHEHGLGRDCVGRMRQASQAQPLDARTFADAARQYIPCCASTFSRRTTSCSAWPSR